MSERTMRLTVLVGDETWHHKPVAYEIVRRARSAGLAGATVFRGVAGYGAGSTIHTLRILSLADGLASMIVIVDREDRLREFLPQLEGLFSDGLVTLEPVEVVDFQKEHQR